MLIAGICIAIILLLINSTYGRAFRAIRDDEIAAEAMGINLFKHKEISFVISSFFAGISGALLAMFQTTINATPFNTVMTYEILLIVVIGGIGSITGSVTDRTLLLPRHHGRQGVQLGQVHRLVEEPSFQPQGMA